MANCAAPAEFAPLIELYTQLEILAMNNDCTTLGHVQWWHYYMQCIMMKLLYAMYNDGTTINMPCTMLTILCAMYNV